MQFQRFQIKRLDQKKRKEKRKKKKKKQNKIKNGENNSNGSVSLYQSSMIFINICVCANVNDNSKQYIMALPLFNSNHIFKAFMEIAQVCRQAFYSPYISYW